MAEDMRPLCRCHGEPMMRSSYQPSGRQKWACRHNRKRHARSEYVRAGKESRRILADSRKAQGLCVRCGREPLLGEALGWDCLNYMEARCAIS